MSTQETTMTTQAVANRLVELCRKGEILACQEELFADNVKSLEPESSPGMKSVSGKQAVIEKSNQFSQMIEAVHGSEISEPVSAGNFFSISWKFDVTLKGQGRQAMDEVCVYEVKDGKVVTEQFFY
jgi:hypothetical protein